MKVIVIAWGEITEPNEEHRYHHVKGESPIGEFLITWKGWKESPSYDVDETPFGYPTIYEITLEAAKEEAQKFFERKIHSCLAGEPNGAIPNT